MTEQTEAMDAKPDPKPDADGITTSGSGETDSAKPIGWDIVDPAKDPPEKVQERINYLYRQMKTGEATSRQAVADARVLAEKIHTLEKRLAQRDTDEATRAIKAQLADATERGDGAKAAELVDQLLHVKQPPDPKPQPQPQPQSADPEVAQLRAWAEERDGTGGLKRPWTQEGHPYQVVAANVGAAVMDHPQWQHRPLPDRLQEIERRMKAELGQPSAPAVLDGGNPPRPEKSVSLSNDQKRVAWNMRPDLTQGDAEKWYAKAMKGVS